MQRFSRENATEKQTELLKNHKISTSIDLLIIYTFKLN